MKDRLLQRFGAMLLLIPASVALVAGQAADKDVVAGDTVTVTVTSKLDDSLNVYLKSVPSVRQSSNCKDPGVIPTTLAPDKQKFSLGIPPDLCPGAYKILVNPPDPATLDDKASIAPRYVKVNQRNLAVTAIDPKSLYHEANQPAYLVFLGPGSLRNDDKYGLSFADHALPQCADGVQEDAVKDCYKQVSSQDGQIRFVIGSQFLNQMSGKLSVSLVHNGAQSAPQDFTVVNEGRDTPRNYAIAIALAIVVLIYLLLSAGHKALKGHKGGFLLTELFLDEETQTYSLSKCQFYAWTFAAILGYVFLAVAKSHIQGSAEFPDIPSGLPGILLFSAGTSVAAIGITSSKGSKGAGPVHPTLADFITSGGVVAPERLQFVVWTVVGIFTFLTIVFNSDPLQVSTLPTIPSGFLQLMGISSAGYLGGKLARKAGPVVQTVSVADVTLKGEELPSKYKPNDEPVLPQKMEQSVVTLNLQGENLDPKARVKVDGQPLRGDQFWITAATPDPQTGFCTEYNLSLTGSETYPCGAHTLTLVNSDSQSSDVAFPKDLMSIDSVDVPAGSAPPAADDVTVTGKNFVGPTTYLWADDKGATVTITNPTDNSQAKIQSSVKLTVNRPPAAVRGSKLTLTLISPAKLRATSNPI